MATTWIAIADDDLDDYLVAAQVTALQTAALKAAQADPFLTVMPDVIAKMRMQIASCERNQLSSVVNSVPPSLKSTACWLILAAMQPRLTGLKFSDEQNAQIEEARKTMMKVAACDYLVEEPTTPVDPGVQGGGALEIVKETKPRVVTKANLAGL